MRFVCGAKIGHPGGEILADTGVAAHFGRDLSANAVDRCVRTIHHLDDFTTPELAACHERAIVRPYAHICVSASVAAEVRDGWGIEATVIPNGVDAERFATAPPGDWRDRFRRYVLGVGGIEPVVLGPVDHDELPSLMASAGVFAFPSTKEGFGLAAMAALAAGVPVVTRELPVLREVLGGVARFATYPPGFARQLRAALAEPDLSRAEDKAPALRNTWPAAAAAHLEFYRALP